MTIDRDAIANPGVLEFLLGLPMALVEFVNAIGTLVESKVERDPPKQTLRLPPAVVQKQAPTLDQRINLPLLRFFNGWRHAESWFEVYSQQVCVQATLSCGHIQLYRISKQAMAACESGAGAMWLLLDQAVKMDERVCKCVTL